MPALFAPLDRHAGQTAVLFAGWLMSLQFLRVHQDAEGHIVAIASRWADGDGRLEIRRAWEHPKGERGIVTEFVNIHSFWARRWQFTPVGLHLEEQLGALWRKSMAYGLIEFGADPWGRKPTIDLAHVLAFLNADMVKPDGAYGDVPPMLYGATLEKFTKRRIGAESVAALVANKQFDAVEAIIQAEAGATMALYGALKIACPAWHKQVLAPMISSVN